MELGISDKAENRISQAIRAMRNMRRNPDLSRLLAIRDSARSRDLLRIGMWMAVGSFIFYGVFDWQLFPDIYQSLVALRIVLGVATICMIEFAIAAKWPLKHLQWLGASAIAVGSLAWLFVARQTDFQVSFALFSLFGSIFILGTNLYFRFKFHVAVLTSLVITIAYASSAMFIDAIPLWTRISVSFFYLNCFALSVYISWQMDVARYDSFLREFQTQQREKRAIERGQELLEIAETDSLTGLSNRRAIERKFSTMVNENKHGQAYCGILLIDADFFKSYNDMLGHQAGDDCLQKLAAAFERVAERYNAIVGRYGGEEFIVICTACDIKEISLFASEICEELHNMNLSHPGRPDARKIMTVSIGASYSAFAEVVPDLNKLTGEADHALYRAKSGGRATYRLFNDHTIDADHSSFGILKSIENAIRDKRICAVYQPLINASSGEIYGHETLMRIIDRNGSKISPEYFIPIAEESGLVCELGEWIIDKACHDFGKNRVGELVSVNVSVVQLRKPGFPLLVMSAIQRHGILPQNLAIEITETTNILEDELVRNAIKQLSDSGIKIWLDDFGTGYAGLKWLRDIDFDLLKIDRLFLNDCENSQGQKMLQDIINLAKNRGLDVLVEGVETVAQKKLTMEFGADYLQGYQFGLPEEKFAELPIALSKSA